VGVGVDERSMPRPHRRGTVDAIAIVIAIVIVC
jgi:hypothetical protein